MHKHPQSNNKRIQHLLPVYILFPIYAEISYYYDENSYRFRNSNLVHDLQSVIEAYTLSPAGHLTSNRERGNGFSWTAMNFQIFNRR